PLLVVGALVLLLVAVAIASTGSVPTGAGGSRRPAERLLDVLTSLLLLVMIAGAALWVYALWIAKDLPIEERIRARAESRRWPRPARPALGALAAGLARWPPLDAPRRRRLGVGAPAGGRPPRTGSGGSGGYEPHFATVPFLIVVALLAAAGGAWYL